MRCAISLTVAALLPLTRADSQTVASRFTTGSSRELVSLTFDASTRGELPNTVSIQSGSVQPVVHLGQPMLRVAERTALLVKLPEVLPQDFSIEIDIVPKTCCQPEDVAIEGTPLIDQGPASANVLWHHEHLMVVGGAVDNTYSGRIPEPLVSAVPGKLTQIVLNVQGDNMTLLTNGQQMFALTNRKFARNNVLRVFLGGQNDTDRAVYLARLRVVANSAPVGPLAGGAAVVVSRSFSLAGFTASGPSPVTSRSIPLAGFTAAGPTPVGSRAIPLAGFTAAGPTPVASRAIPLAGFTAAGTATRVASRTITPGGFVATGTSTPVASRTITLTGWNSTGKP